MDNPFCLCTADEAGVVLVEPIVKPFTWRDALVAIHTMTDEQLDMPMVYSIVDIRDGVVSGISVTTEDHYTDGEYIDPKSVFKPGHIEEHELELKYRKGQPILDI